MHSPQKLIGSALLAAAMIVTVAAQRPRSMASTDTDQKNTAQPATAPQTVKAKYEGGVFGYRKTMAGTLSFDDTNQRLLFRNEQQKEVFFIPYGSVTSAFADTQKRQPAAATVASHVPYVGLPASFIKTKVRYLTIQYNDQDSQAASITSFKLENKELVASMLAALAEKSGLSPRGEIYVRKKDPDSK
jgi:hypothetical protein